MTGQPLRLRSVLAANLLRIRAEKGLSQEACADLVGLDRSYFGSIERAKRNVAIDNIERIADGLGVTAVELLRCADGLS